VGTVSIEGDGEQAVSGGDGLIYLNLEDKSEVAAFDPKTLTVKKRFALGAGQTPTGLAMDTQNNRLFVACRSEALAVMDAETGKLITRLPIGVGVDAAAFDAESRLIFASNNDGTLSIFEQKSPDIYADLGAVVTHAGAKTMAFDAKTKKIFLPAADVEIIPTADPAQKPLRRVTPDTFSVIVLDRVN
jgi:outer membrane protein assembly factor BamB